MLGGNIALAKCNGKRIVIIAFFLFFYMPDFAQHSNMKEKIDPVFISLINQQKVKDSITAKKSYARTSTKDIEVETPKKAPIEKTYECIVYTKYATALREKGIVVNSELPAFVTTIATLKQIEQMSGMSEVTYIKAPSVNILH